ncbi:MAG TPA: NAD(P)-dependent oxidoreductase [Chthonomonadales bacterium]|nr:NAD(P)-dependent oxidoreductase [Chthonomonadales bacterium]
MGQKARPKVLLDPHFRTVGSLFDDAELMRLSTFAELLWCKNEQAPADYVQNIETELEAIVTGWWRYGDVARFPRLKAILEVAGMFPPRELLDYEHCFGRGIKVLGCAPGFAPAVAEMSLGLAIAAARGIVRGDSDFRTGTEIWGHAGAVQGFQLFDKLVGFIGYGSIARALKDLLAPFHCRLQAYDPWLTTGYLRSQGVIPVDLGTLLGTSRIIFVLAVPTRSNRKLLSRARLLRIRHGSVLVLTSRAHLVDFEALTELAGQGRFTAAIDVFPEEPLPADHSVRAARDTILSAHRAGGGEETYRLIGRMVSDDLEAVLGGLSPQRMQQALPEVIRNRG